MKHFEVNFTWEQKKIIISRVFTNDVENNLRYAKIIKKNKKHRGE
jgi:hypothetical protein